MPIPSRLEVSFGQYAKSLLDEALAKLPSQFLTSCMLRQLVAVFVGEVQELYAAVLDMQRGRTLYAAEAANLDALGRIVGEERAPYQYSDSHWFAFDRMGQAWDSTPWWCRDAPLVEYIPAEDPVYRTNILTRIIANHTLVASVPELDGLIRLVAGNSVSFEKTGPIARKQVPDSRRLRRSYFPTNLVKLTTAVTTRRVDDEYAVPYPATLHVSGYIVFVPVSFFSFDKSNVQRWDSGRWASKGNLFL